MNYRNFSKSSLLLKSLIATLLLFGIFTVAKPPKAAAAVNNINDVPGFIQTQMFNEDVANCNGFRHAQFVWLSQAGNNGVTTVTLNQGQDSLNLQLNTLAGQCNNNIKPDGTIDDTQIVYTRTHTNGASTSHGFISSGLVGSNADLYYGWSNLFNLKYVTGPPFAYPVLHTDFTISGLAGLGVGVHHVTVQVDTTLVNQYNRPDGSVDYICVTPNPDGTPHFATDLNGMGRDGVPCGKAGPTFPIDVNIISVDQPTVGKIEGGSCDIGAFASTDRGSVTTTTQASIVGWAKDPDYDFTQVHVYIDGVNPNDLAEKVFVGSYDANRYPRTLNGVDIYAPQGRTPYGTGVPDWHNWFVVPKSDMSRFSDAYLHNVYVYGIGKNKDGSNNANNPELIGSPLRMGNCSPITCTVSTIPAPPEVGVQFDIIFSYIYGNPGPQGRPITPTASVRFNGGPIQSFTFGATRASGSRTFTSPTFKQNSPGVFTINASVTQANAYFAGCDNNNTRVTSRPYVKVYGNDVMTGGKFADATATECTSGPTPVTPDASIWAFDKKVNANGQSYYGGATGQFGVSALGDVDSFSSAGARNGLGAPKPATGLSFGNMINNTAVTDYGGDSGMHACVPNYYSASSNPGADVRAGPANITQGNAAPGLNQQRAVFVNGDAYITKVGADLGITYPGSGGWTSTSQIPNFYLIVKGNIYIDHNVSNLDGTYIAQPDAAGNKGIIYTCTNGASLYAAGQLYDNCRTKLTVNGSFIAKQVKYLRTNGTVGLSIADGPPANPQLGFTWSSFNEVPGQVCVPFNEGSDPTTWYDNFLCSQNDYGLRFSGNLPIPGMTCINLRKPAPYPVAYTWDDNFLCWPPARNLQLSWSTSGPENPATRYCTNIFEIASPLWGTQTFICEPLITPPLYSPVNEPANSNNIAEVFNFSQEVYLAPTPTILQTVIGLQGPSDKPRYESITSLPPVL